MDVEQRARLEKLVVPTWPLVTVDRGDLLALLTAYDDAVKRARAAEHRLHEHSELQPACEVGLCGSQRRSR